jgi:hypothetical protein
MPWAVAIRRLDIGKIQLVTDDLKVDCDDPNYGDDVHVVPCKVVPLSDGYVDTTFGSHEFTRKCYCDPVLESQLLGKNIIRHREGN